MQQILMYLQHHLIHLIYYLPKFAVLKDRKEKTLKISKLSIMKVTKKELSPLRIKRIREQGYTCQNDQEISNLAFGNRFAYQFCLSLLFLGVLFANIPLLSAMLIIAFFGVVLPNHPFDYIYNYFLRKLLSLPKLPNRSPQLKFACALASIFITVTIVLFHSNNIVVGYIVGSTLLSVAFLVSTFDLCIPSIIYNTIQKKILTKKNN